MTAYLRTVLIRIYTDLVCLVFDRHVFTERPLQWIKARAFNRLRGSGIADESLLMKGTSVVRWANLSVGRWSYVARDVRIDAFDRVAIGSGVTVGPGTFISTGGHSVEDLSPTHAPVSIGDGAFIGARAVILAGVSIGRHACVGAGAVVNKSVPDHAVVAGVPARLLGTRVPPATVWTVFGTLDAASWTIKKPA